MYSHTVYKILYWKIKRVILKVILNKIKICAQTNSQICRLRMEKNDKQRIFYQFANITNNR